jgi:GxxExxY protein
MGYLAESLRRNRYDGTDYTDCTQIDFSMNPKETYPHVELTEKIIGAAYEVHNKLGGGFVEKVYENALAAELRKRGHAVQQQKPMTVEYEGESVGEFAADMIVDETVLVEIKAVKALTNEYELKLIHYLKTSRIEVGLLLNFADSVQVRRKIFTPKSQPSVNNL